MVPAAALRDEGRDLVGWWENPNIQPATEYAARRQSAREYAARLGLELREGAGYDVAAWLAAAPAEKESRCRWCVTARVRGAARAAAARGMAAFTTTMLYSPFLPHEAIRAAGAAAAREGGLEFLDRDWRPRYPEGRDRARALDLYRQKYCGCIFSEAERFGNRTR